MSYEQMGRGRVGMTAPDFVHGADAFHTGDMLPNLPILTTTRLQLELLLNDSVIDLKAVTDVILADAGATLQILRLIGSECVGGDGRSGRMEDCIASLSIARCRQVLCAPNTCEPDAYSDEWQLWRRRAEYARELAREIEGVSPEEAYLVGLLCRIGAIPALLGWTVPGASAGGYDAVGVMLAFHWNLPPYVSTAITEQQEAARQPKWRDILRVADEMARQLTDIS